MQPVDQVPRSAGHRTRARCQGAGAALRCLAQAASGGRALYRARDSDRDQSYFLFATTPAQLDPLRFPLGERSKAETRDLARRFGLPVADKQDSQDICFVPSGRYAQVIERLRPGAAEPGDIVDIEGACSAGTTASSFHGRAAARTARRHRASALRGAARCGDAPRRGRSARALRISSMRLRDVNWLGDGALDEALADEPRRDVSRLPAKTGRG